MLAISFLLLLLLLLSCSTEQKMETTMDHVKSLDLSQYSSAMPDKPIDLLFIHHSTGGQLLADKGSDLGANCIYQSHPNGGGLRRLLEKNNYRVHEASYTSMIGDQTDICHWHAKFKNLMDKILVCKNQDEFFTDGTKNRVVIFKSCFPNNWIESDGMMPGDPDSCDKTLANAEAAYESLLPFFKEYPETLYVVMTAPPLANPVLSKKDRVVQLIKTAMNKPDTIEKIGRRARMFNNWLRDTEKGWLKDYKLNNVVVYDYYDVLTNHGKSNWSQYPTKGGSDSHPSSDGNTIAAGIFVPFLNASVHRLGRYD